MPLIFERKRHHSEASREHIDEELARIAQAHFTRRRWEDFMDETATCESFADALVNCDWRNLATRRSLACTCSVYRFKMKAWYAKPQLDLEPVDCTDGNANFVLGPLRRMNPNVLIWTPDLQMPVPYHDMWFMTDFIADHEIPEGVVLQYNGSPVNAAGQDIHYVRSTYMNTVEAFFVGRCIAKVMTRAAILVEWTEKIGEDGEPADKFFVFSSHALSSNVAYPIPHSTRRAMGNHEYQIIAGCALVAAHAELDRILANRTPKDAKSEIAVPPSVVLSHNRLDDQGAEAIARRIAKFDRPLQLLDLGHTVTPLSDGMLGQMLLNRFETSCIKQLNLNNNLLGDENTKLLSRMFAGGFFHALVVLGLRDVGMTDEHLSLLVPSFDALTLKVLNISNNTKITDAGILHVMNSCLSMVYLKELHILHLTKCTFHGMQCFASWIRERSYWADIAEVRVCPPAGTGVANAPRLKDLQALMDAATACARTDAEWRKCHSRFTRAHSPVVAQPVV